MLLREDDTNYEMISSPIIHANVTRAAHTGRMRILIVSDAGAPQINGVVSTLTQTASWLNRFGHDVEQVTPAQFRSLPCPTYPEIRVALRGYRGIITAIHSYRHRRPAWTRRATLLSGTRAAIYYLLPYAISAIYSLPCSDPPSAHFFCLALVSQRRRALPRQYPGHSERSEVARLHKARALGTRSRYRAVSAAGQGLSESASSDCCLRRAGRGGKKHQRIHAHELDGKQARDRRWTGVCKTQGGLPGSAVCGIFVRRCTGTITRGSRCFSIPQPQRYIWTGHARGHGLRRAHRRISRYRPDRCRR